MDEPEPTVFIVDDDEAIRRSLTLLLETVGMKTETCTSCGEFLNALDPTQPGCLVLDVRMRGMSGLELQAKLKADGIDIPVIIITGHGDVPMAVQAVKAGALDFIEKPFRDHVLMDNIRKAVRLDARMRQERAERADVEAKLELLTPKERRIMKSLIIGNEDKQIALQLGVSRRAVAFHRANILEKMEVSNVVELIALLSKLDTSL